MSLPRESRPPTVQRRWRLRFLIGLLALILVGMAAFTFIPVSRADDTTGMDFQIQVVLGGNTRERSDVCYELWLRHPTPILVTGDGNYIREALLKLGIPASEIIHETQACNTWENAEFSIPLLHERNIESAVIVTSWFHTGRAHACFEHQAPGIRFATRSDPLPAEFGFEDWKLMAKERLKAVGYWIKYSLDPWEARR